MTDSLTASPGPAQPDSQRPASAGWKPLLWVMSCLACVSTAIAVAMWIWARNAEEGWITIGAMAIIAIFVAACFIVLALVYWIVYLILRLRERRWNI
ncbi:hypothetical protein NQ038_11640 [Brevibacterium sp. 50QC2O2]|uniref:hypothetical protein n=2 Tax=Brevibacterium TaxID=1696 RepID=UPI00211CCC5B|nr:hypothetical protein [Brevibacterium sp. 68QC2CO]MCQ9389291.1 hypothetical protein [Brevibacterium sp. 50QC2O2]